MANVNQNMVVQNSSKTINGVVLDENKQPVIGATVKVRGVNKGVITDADGRFSIDLEQGQNNLEISYIGYQPLNVTVGNKTQMTVNIEPDNKVLDEVVVIGYGSIKKRDLSGSVVSIKSDQILATPTTNVMEALQGKIAGADIVMNSGAIGSDVDILLRGSRSINGNNSPLFIIDGVQGADFTQINPNDIESLDVLKDASSTAIYGSAGANGVVIITTKRGQEGKIISNLNAYYGFSGTANFLHGMTGDEFMNYNREVYRTKNEMYPEHISQMFSSEVIQQAIADGKWIDWIDEVTQGNTSQEDINFSVSGGTSKVKVFSSLSYNKQTGLLQNENMSRYGVRFNVDYELRPWAKIGMGSNLNYSLKNSRGKNVFTKSLTAFPLGDVYDEFGDINTTYIEGHTTPMGDECKDQYANETRQTSGQGNAYLELTPVKGLSFKSLISASTKSSRNGLYIGAGSISGVESGYAAPLATISNSYSYGYQWDNILTYNTTVKKDHDITATGIVSWGKNMSDNNNMRAQGQSLDYYLFHNMSAGTEKTGLKSSYSQSQSMSYAFRLNYSYKGRYIASFTTRWDGASHLAEGHKWASFPAGAVAWRISDEEFMSSTKSWLSNFKLRLSYGVTGNSGGMGSYSSLTGANFYNVVSADGELVNNAQLAAPFANSMIGWEKSYNKNLGIDLGFFNNRIHMSMELYNTDTKDLLFQRTLPISSAITYWGSPINMWQNIGETNNKGFEIELSTDNVRTKNFKWNSSLTFTRNREKIVNLPDGDLIAKNLFEGHPIKTFYNYKYAGIWKSSEAEEAALYGCKPGYVKIHTVEQFTQDENGNQVGDGGVHTYSNTRDLQILGSNVPDFILGFSNKFEYKGFDLSAFLVVRAGQMIESKAIGWYDAGSNNQPAGSDYWTPENENAYFPRPGIASTTGIESLKYVDGSYAKLKNVSIGYNLPKNAIRFLGMSKCRLYATAYNVFVFPFSSALKNTDPENNGSDSFPLYKSYVVGFNLSF